MYVPDDDAVYRVAAQGGAEQHPVWYYNLIESRTVTLQVQGRKRVMGVETVSTEGGRAFGIDASSTIQPMRSIRLEPREKCLS